MNRPDEVGRTRPSWPAGRVALAVYAPAVAAIVLTRVVATTLDVSFGFFSRDPATVYQGNPLVGALSNVGIVVWSAGAVVCLSAWFVLRRLPSESSDATPSAPFFFWSGVLTAVLMCDDLFLVHENLGSVLPGLNEAYLFVGYVLLVAAYSVRFRKILLSSADRWVFIAAGAFFALSIGADAFQGVIEPWPYEIEDGPKVLGIFGWTGYLIRSAWLTMASHFPPGLESAPH